VDSRLKKTDEMTKNMGRNEFNRTSNRGMVVKEAKVLHSTVNQNSRRKSAKRPRFGIICRQLIIINYNAVRDTKSPVKVNVPG
jgi:hypothetical protein